MENIEDSLLDAWLKVTAVLMNHRMVKGMSFNEAFVCNLLNRRYLEDAEAEVTATWLCQETGMLKSQMNKTLNELEKKELITRERSEEDRRKVFIHLCVNHMELYHEEHAEIMSFVRCLIQQAGEEKAKQAAALFTELSDIIAKMEEGEEGWQYKS